MTLPDQQKQFMAGIYNADTAIEADIEEGILTSSQRMQVYRNNAFLLLEDNLAITFPVIKKLVGDKFFKQVAQAYVDAHTPTSYDMFAYGKKFSDFLESYEPAQDHPYLADVAKLEFLREEAYRAADAKSLDHAMLKFVADEEAESLILEMHPSCHLLTSPWPVHKIWQNNQEGVEPETINLDEGEAFVLVSRPQADVLVWALDKSEYVFLQTIGQGGTLPQAIALAQSTSPQFAGAKVLAHHLSGGTFAGFKTEKA